MANAVAATQKFSLEQHAGAYETWPLRSSVFASGERTATRVPGYVLLHQFEIPQGYVLITDCDCPFEEATSFILLDHSYRMVSRRTLAVPYGSFNLESIEWIDSAHLNAGFYDDDHWLISVLPWGIPFLRPRLQLRRLNPPR